jgi:hypothetical protein
VHLLTPVPESMVKPAGRFVALKVLPSGATIASVISAPSALVWPPSDVNGAADHAASVPIVTVVIE